MSIEKELRLGNLVNCQKNDGSGLMIVRVQTLSVSEYPSGIGKAVGIPLTEKWLLRFSFEFNGEVWVNEGRGLILTRYLNYLNFTPSGSEYVGQIKIEYVHQLQNLYFALTGQELEIKNPSPTNADKGQLS